MPWNNRTESPAFAFREPMNFVSEKASAWECILTAFKSLVACKQKIRVSLDLEEDQHTYTLLSSAGMEMV